MKRSIIIAAALVAALTSCQKEQLREAQGYGDFCIRATMEDFVGTKSTLNGVTFGWTKGDAIGVYDGSKFQPYYAKESAASSVFTGEESTSLQKVAVYPAALSPVYSSGLSKVTLPSSYEWEEGQTNCPMIAEFENISDGLTFKYLGGIVKVTLKSVPADATTLEFSTDKAITGEFSIATDGSNKEIQSSSASSTGNTVTFSFDGVAAAEKVFYVPVPVGTYTMSIAVKRVDGTKILTKTGTTANTIARKDIASLPAVTIDASISGGGESGSISVSVPSTHKGTFYLPSTSGTVDVTMKAGNVNNVEFVYAVDGEHPKNVNIICEGNIGSTESGTGLTVTLPDSHVEISRSSAASDATVVISALVSSTSAATLVIKKGVAIAEKLTVAAGSVEIAGTVKDVEVKDTVDDAVTVKVAEGATVSGTLKVAKAASVTVEGTVGAMEVAASVSDVTVADGSEIASVKAADGTVTAYVASESALSAALAAADKVIVKGDITGDFTVAADKEVTVNLNGKTLTNSTGDNFTVALGGKLTIEGDGTVDNVSHGKACIYNNGEVVLNGGTYTRSKENGGSKESAGGNSYYNILNHGTMTIADGVTVSQSGGFSSMIANGYYNYTSTNPRSGYVAGTNAQAPSLTITGGSFTGGLNTIKNDDGANLIISGGTFTNTKQACVQNNNTATISGGTFTPTGENGEVVAVQSIHYDGEVNAGTTEITGGTFNGALVSYNGGVFKICGGTFSEDVSEWIVVDYYVVENSGKYSVEKFVISEKATTKVSQNIAVSCVSAGKNATLELVEGAVITGTGQESTQADVLMTSNGLTLKGNGKIVSNVPSTRKTSDVIRVGGGTLNIYDGITLEGGSGNEANYAIRIVKGTVNIYGGYFHTSNEGQCELIYLASGYAASNKCYLNISGGVFDCDGDASYMINCYDSYRSKCTVSITGGIFVGFNPADNIAEGEHTNFCADGYTTEETIYNGKTAWKVVAKSAE